MITSRGNQLVAITGGDGSTANSTGPEENFFETNKNGIFNQSRISELNGSEVPSKLTRFFANSQF